MNFKTETTFEGRVLNGKILDNKVVLDELFGVSLVNEVKLDRQQVKNLMYDLSTLHSEMKDSVIGNGNLKIDDKSIQGIIKSDSINNSGQSCNIKGYNIKSDSITVDNINTLSYIDLIETIGKGLEVSGKNNSAKLI